MKSLIIGMGFGNAVYKPVLEQMGSMVVTVDSKKPLLNINTLIL